MVEVAAPAGTITKALSRPPTATEVGAALGAAADLRPREPSVVSSYPEWNPVEIEARGITVVEAAVEDTETPRAASRGHSKRRSSKPPLRALAWKVSG